MITLTLPQFLTSLADNQQELIVNANNFHELKNYLITSFPDLEDKLWEEDGKVKRNVLFVLNDELLKYEKYETINFQKDDEVKYYSPICRRLI